MPTPHESETSKKPTLPEVPSNQDSRITVSDEDIHSIGSGVHDDSDIISVTSSDNQLCKTTLADIIDRLRRRGTEEDLLVGIVADEDTCTGFALAGILEATPRKKNYFIVYPHTSIAEIRKHYMQLLRRDDIAFIAIDQGIANRIRNLINHSMHLKLGAVIELKPIYDEYHYFDDTVLSIFKNVNIMRDEVERLSQPKAIADDEKKSDPKYDKI